MHALVLATLLQMAGLDALDGDAEPEPPAHLRLHALAIRIESIDQRSEGLGRCGLPRSVKVRRADNDGQTTEEACPDVGKSAGFQRLSAGYWLLRLPAAHATRDIPLPKTAVGATLVPTVGNARNVG